MRCVENSAHLLAIYSREVHVLIRADNYTNGILCVPPCPLWLNLERDEFPNFCCPGCHACRCLWSSHFRLETRCGSSCAPEQPGRRLHEPAAFREGVELFSAGCGSRSQAGDRAAERGHCRFEPAEN